MYSPKIDEDLIPVLYRMAKEKGITMTELVRRILKSYLAEIGKTQKGGGYEN